MIPSNSHAIRRLPLSVLLVCLTPIRGRSVARGTRGRRAAVRKNGVKEFAGEGPDVIYVVKRQADLKGPPSCYILMTSFGPVLSEGRCGFYAVGEGVPTCAYQPTTQLVGRPSDATTLSLIKRTPTLDFTIPTATYSTFTDTTAQELR